MRIISLPTLIAAIFFVGCAHEGVIVQKNSNPLPFYHSLGVDGSYSFILRDRSGAMHRQIVTPEVFERYGVGDYFNDLQPGPAGKEVVDGKTMRTAVQPVAVTTPRVTKIHRTAKTTRIATTRKHKAQKHVVRRSKHHAPVTKVARTPQASPRIAQTKDTQILFVSVARCR